MGNNRSNETTTTQRGGDITQKCNIYRFPFHVEAGVPLDPKIISGSPSGFALRWSTSQPDYPVDDPGKIPPHLWTVVSCDTNYTPSSSALLKLEVVENNSNKVLATKYSNVIEVSKDYPEREWINCQHTNNGKSITVMTYNILADSYCDKSRYHYCPEFALEPAYREAKILEHVKKQSPDILALQELEKETYIRFGESLSEYEKDYQQRPRVDGCGIFFKKEKFKLIYKKPILYDEICNYPEIATLQNNHNFLTGNVGLILLLELIGDRDKPVRFWVTTTHLFWNPAFSEVKLMQIHYTLNCIKEAMNQTQDGNQYPMILLGDFNSLPGSEVYNYMLNSLNQNEVPNNVQNVVFSHSFQLTSAYQTQNEPPSNVTADFEGCLDYIWFEKTSFVLEGILGHALDYKNMVALPNLYYPSDHVSLMARLSFKERKEDQDL